MKKFFCSFFVAILIAVFIVWIPSVSFSRSRGFPENREDNVNRADDEKTLAVCFAILDTSSKIESLPLSSRKVKTLPPDSPLYKKNGTIIVDFTNERLKEAPDLYLPPQLDSSQIDSAFKYPPEAVENKIEGETTLDAFVDKYGTVVFVRTIFAANAILEKAAKRDLRKIKFLPAIRSGKPIEDWITIKIKYEFVGGEPKVSVGLARD